MTLRDTIDSNTHNLSNITIGANSTSCGSNVINSSLSNALQLSDIEIGIASECDVTFQVEVKVSTPDNANILNTATIGVPSGGGSGAMPSSKPLIVEIFPALSFTNTDNDTDNDVLPGDVVTYTLTVSNTG